MAKSSPKSNPSAGRPTGLSNLLYEALETELGGVQIYTNAIRFAITPDLRSEWEGYLAETLHHVQVVRGLLKTAGLDPDAEVAPRYPVRLVGETLVQAIVKSTGGGDPAASQLVAAECVVLAETTAHANWEALSLLAQKLSGELGEALSAACNEVEAQEDRHLFHTKGWARELRAKSLGLPAELPPPEERQNVDSAIAAARAKAGRTKHPS
jgi:hypothetical protein